MTYNKALELAIPSQKFRGRPKTSYENIVFKDLSECNVSEDYVDDRAKWRKK